MIKEGWVPRAAVEHPWFLPDHSVTLWHPTWPCEVDVHRFYPGFLAAPAAAFDELWNAHEVTELAHCPVNVCAPAGNVAILALHGLRNGGLRGMDEEYERLVARVADDPALAAAVARVAERTGAVVSLEPFLDAVGTSAQNGIPVSSADLTAWRLLVGGDATPTLAWLHQLTRTPVWRWPRVMWRALTYTDDRQGTSRRSGRLLRRALRGLRSIPASIGSLRSTGSSRR